MRTVLCRGLRRYLMALLRQYVSLLIVLLILLTVLVLNYLSLSGQLESAVDAEILCPPPDSGGASVLNQSTCHSQARGWRTPAVLTSWPDRCGEGKVPENYTAEELGLADAAPRDVAWKRGSLGTPADMEQRILALLKSRNPCQRSDSRGSGLACLPYYYLAGFPKCGSTDLYLRLTSHPHILRHHPHRKELHWVTKGRFHFPQGRTEALRSYKALMGRTLLRSSLSVEDLSNAIVGDHSVSTLWDNSQWQNIPANSNCSSPRVLTADVLRHLNPQAKVMVMVRDPTQRLYSAHLYFNPNSSRAAFHGQAVRAVQEARDCFLRYGLRRCVYHLLSTLTPPVHVGLYHVYIADWLQRFPRGQLHVIRLEDMAVKGEEELRKALAFLGVGVPSKEWLQAVSNQPVARVGRRVRQQGPMLKETRHVLDLFYRPFNRKLALLLQDRKYEWLDAGT